MSSTSTIYESSTSASPTLLHLILATLIPVKQRIRIGSSIERHAPDGSLTRAVLSWGTTVGVGLLLLKVFGNHHHHHHHNVESSSSQENIFSFWAMLSEMLGIKRDNTNRIDTNSNSRSISSRKNGQPTTPKSLFPFSDAIENDVVHEGSCHCGAISFEVNAPRCLTLRFPQDDTADDSDDIDASFDLASVISSVRRQQGNAILYPSAKVDASGFRLLSGQEQWKTYHIQVRRQRQGEEHNNNGSVVVTKAYSFCRVCAVHLLHASDDDAFSISINVHTLTTPWTSTLEEEARDIYNQDEEEEEEEDSPRGRRPTFRSASSRSQTQKQQHKKNKPPSQRRKLHSRNEPQQQRQQTSTTRRIVTPQQGDLADTAMSSSSYMMTNNPISTGVDWPMVDDDDHDDDDDAECNHYTADEEEESTISSTTTTSSSPLLDGTTATTATTMSASTMTQSVVAEQQQQQQRVDATSSSHTTADPVTREKLRQYMAKHMMKKNKTTTTTIAETNHF